MYMDVPGTWPCIIYRYRTAACTAVGSRILFIVDIE
eukprot:COSAG01_NODE_69476_length_261_cov_0.641975_1_plen_35_part_10